MRVTRRQVLSIAAAASSMPAIRRLCAAEGDGGDTPPGGIILTSIRELFRDLPGDLAPKPSVGWDKFTVPKVKAWLDLTWVNHPMRMMGKLEEVTVAENPVATGAHDRWRATVKLTDETFPYRGVTLAWGFGVLTLDGDEAFARRAEKVPKGRVLRLEATIESMELTVTDGTSAKLTIRPKDLFIPNLR